MQCALKTECFAGGAGIHSRWQAWGTGGLPFPAREACFCRGLGYGKRASRTGTIPVGKRGVREASCRTGSLFLHRRGVREACFQYGNPFLLAGVGNGKVPFPYGSPVSAQAWGTGSMLPVRDPIPVGKRGLREGCLPAREACFCTGVGFGKVTPFGVLKL